ncbi:LAFE_0E11738g1_1 [Lachancea fermentati]|uniref:LAFE_0E11738g1_1 n=1 Tax=Lachancea fermentati TaxID=4955 RepID=A0A1G4MDZ6_LACFM|nr:LAFE_0E11738g1_1 [Lachancea fermentati]
MASNGGELPTSTSEDFGFKPLGKLQLLPSYKEQLPFSQLQNFAISSIQKLFAAASKDKVIVGSLQALRDATVAEGDEESQKLNIMLEKELKDVVFTEFTQDGKKSIFVTLSGTVHLYDLENKEWSTFSINKPGPGDVVSSVKMIPGIFDALLAQIGNVLYLVLFNGQTESINTDIAAFDVGLKKYTIWSKDGAVILHDAATKTEISRFSTPEDIAEELKDDYLPVSISFMSENHFLLVYGNDVRPEDEEEEASYDHKMYFVSVDGENVSYKESFDIAPAFGTILRDPTYYHLVLYDLVPSVPHLYIVTSACTSELSIVDDTEVIQPNQDSDRAVLPISQETDNDTNPIGIGLDIVTSGDVVQPCQGVDSASCLPLVYVLNDEGTLQIFSLFHCSAIKAGNFDTAQTLKRFQDCESESLISTKNEKGTEDTHIQSQSPQSHENDLTEEKESLGNDVEISSGVEFSDKDTLGKVSSDSKNPDTPLSGTGAVETGSSSVNTEASKATSSPFGQPIKPAFGVSNDNSNKVTSGQFSFGNKPFNAANDERSVPAFGKPAFGNAVFSSGAKVAENSSLSNAAQGTPAFGTPAFGAPAFGTPAFGSPAFGTPAFGKPAFGNPASEESGVQTNISVFGKPSFGTTTFGSSNKSAKSSPFGKPTFGDSTAAKSPFESGKGGAPSGDQTNSSFSSKMPTVESTPGKTHPFGNFTSGSSNATNALFGPSDDKKGKPLFGQKGVESTSANKPPVVGTNSIPTPFGKPAFAAVNNSTSFGKPAFETPTSSSIEESKFGPGNSESKEVKEKETCSKPVGGDGTASVPSILPKAQEDIEENKEKTSDSSVKESKVETVTFGQPSFGQTSFGQPSFGQSSFGKSSFGQSTFGKPNFGQAAFGQDTSATANSAFGKPSFGDNLFKPLNEKETPSPFSSLAKSDSPFSSFANTESPFSQLKSGKSPFSLQKSPFSSTKKSSEFPDFNSKLNAHKPAESPFSGFSGPEKDSNTQTLSEGDTASNSESDGTLNSDEDGDSSESPCSTKSQEDMVTSFGDTSAESKLLKVDQKSSDSDSRISSESSQAPKNDVHAEKTDTDYSSITERIKKAANLSDSSFMESSVSPNVGSPKVETLPQFQFSDALKSSPAPSFSFANLGKKVASQRNENSQSTSDETKFRSNQKNNASKTLNSKLDPQCDKLTTTEPIEKRTDSAESLFANNSEPNNAGPSKESVSSKVSPPENVSSKEESLEEVELNSSSNASEEFSETNPASSSNSEKRAGTAESESFDELDDLKEELERVKNEEKSQLKVSSPALVPKGSEASREMTSNETQTYKEVADADIQTEPKEVSNFEHKTFENDEVYLATQNPSRPLNEFYDGAKVVGTPHKSSDETLQRIETTYSTVTAELSVLEENLNNICSFIKDQSCVHFKRTEETIHQNYSWRMSDCSTLNEILSKICKALREKSAKISELDGESNKFKDSTLSSTKKSQFSLRDQYEQLKYLYKEHTYDVRDLSLEQSRMQNQLRGKLAKVRMCIRELEETLQVLKLHSIRGTSNGSSVMKTFVEDYSRHSDLFEVIQSLRREVAELQLASKHESSAPSKDTDITLEVAAITELGLRIDTKRQIGQYLLSRNT